MAVTATLLNRLAGLGTALLLAACATTPLPRGEPGLALPAAQSGPPAAAAEGLGLAAGESAYRLVIGTEGAFAMRMCSAALAERRIDVQYCMWHDDLTGRLLAGELPTACRPPPRNYVARLRDHGRDGRLGSHLEDMRRGHGVRVVANDSGKAFDGAAPMLLLDEVRTLLGSATEEAVVVSPCFVPLRAPYERAIDPARSWRVELEGGQLRWYDVRDGRPVVSTREPQADTGRKAMS